MSIAGYHNLHLNLLVDFSVQQKLDIMPPFFRWRRCHSS